MTHNPQHHEEMSYEDALRTCDREALATMGVAIVLALFFWGAIALLGDSTEGWWGLPLWFWVACLGGYVLSVLLTYWLVKRVFREMDFDRIKTPTSDAVTTTTDKEGAQS